MAVDASGNIIVADGSNHRVQVFAGEDGHQEAAGGAASGVLPCKRSAQEATARV